MAEYTRVSLRAALEGTRAAITASREAYDRLSEHGASESTSALATAVEDLQEALGLLESVDAHIQKKAGLLPDAPAGGAGAK